jgi:hypothetical protein
MDTAYVDTEQAVLNLLHRYGILTMDEIVRSGNPGFSWAQVFLAIDRLSRQKLIVVHRTGSDYQVALSTQAWITAHASQQEETADQPG